METYKNILIRETRPNVIDSIKTIIDYLYTHNYNTYEVTIEIAELNGKIVYKTCLAEDDDRYMDISGEIPEILDNGKLVKRCVVKFSGPTVMDNAHPNNMDYVENCDNIMDAIAVLSKYYTPNDMKLITSIEIN